MQKSSTMFPGQGLVHVEVQPLSYLDMGHGSSTSKISGRHPTLHEVSGHLDDVINRNVGWGGSKSRQSKLL